MQEYIKIKNVDIPLVIRNFKTAKYLKMYFKADVLHISKPKYIDLKTVMSFIQANEEKLYKQYIKINSTENSKIKKWNNGEKIFFKGKEYDIFVKQETTNKIQLKLDNENKKLNIIYPENIDEKTKKENIDRGIKKLLKNNTLVLLEEKVPYWSKITNILYKQFKVNDATSKFGSCVPKTRVMHFSSRLIMLPEDKIDAIVVHELCHIVYPNHSKDFYNLVRKYIPNYDEINKWLKENGKIIMF